MSDSTKSLLETTSKIFLRSWLIGMAMLLFWFGLHLTGIYHGFHQSIFHLTEQEVNVVNYCGMGLLKILLFAFFLCPWLALKSMSK